MKQHKDLNQVLTGLEILARRYNDPELESDEIKQLKLAINAADHSIEDLNMNLLNKARKSLHE